MLPSIALPILRWEPALWRRHRELPRLLRVYSLVPLSALVVAILGLVFNLPPGPLCDEGMVLFMEGGCDWGLSNLFFFSKLGLLISLTAAFLVAWVRGVRGHYSAFVAHFLVAGVLVWKNRDGGICDTYYANPNGSLGQMVLEVASLAVVGIAVLGLARCRRWWRGVLAVLACHLVAIVQFYLWLRAFDHWQWQHTWAIVATNLVVAVALSRLVVAIARGERPNRAQP